MSTYSTVGRDAQALVCDIGSYSTKIGYAGDDHPCAIFGSTTAVERQRQGTGSNFAQGPRRDFVTRCCSGGVDDGAFELANPIDPVTGWLFSPPRLRSPGDGAAASLSSNENNEGRSVGVSSCAWESHELVSHSLRHAFQSALGINVDVDADVDVHQSEHPLLLLDKPHTPPALRQRLLELLFETHSLPAVFLLRDAVASCYAVGRTTGTVVDAGHSATMVTPVYEGFVESRGVLRNVGCAAHNVDARILDRMDHVVKTQGGRKRRDRIRRINLRKWEDQQAHVARVAANNAYSSKDSSSNSMSSPTKVDQATKVATGGVKRDAAGHFVKEKAGPTDHPVPDYLMPIYQIRRAPVYASRIGQFHAWSRLALAREIKEMGLGVAVGPTGYVCSTGASVATKTVVDENAGVAPAEGVVHPSSMINPASANSVFLTSSRLPYVLPDGTHVEITTSSRCDIAELYFGNDELNVNYRDDKFDEAVRALEQYKCDIEDFLVEKDDENELEGKEKGGDAAREGKSATMTSGFQVGDPYSNTSYLGLGKSRPVGRSSKYYPPETVSRKLYSACLSFVRTTPPSINHGQGGGGGRGGDNTATPTIDANYFHYLTSAPPAQMVCDAAFRCDRDQQASLLGNVVVCGGGACITGAAGVSGSAGQVGGAVDGATVSGVMASMLGDEHAFPDRLRDEIEAIVHRHTPNWRVKVTSPNVSERAICSWLGGSILGSLGTFQDMWISKKDYEEFGAAIVNRKCP